MKRIGLFIVGILVLSTLMFATDKDSANYKPNIKGTIRTKYEYNSSLDAHRFQVRNARFNVSGKFSKITSYKAEIDLSDEGITKMLDAYVRFNPNNWFQFTVGQQKIPFGTDNLRGPHELYFANRSFVGKQLPSGLRDVGATIMFSNKKVIPFDIQAGIYNGNGLYNQQKWEKAMNYVFRLETFLSKNIEISVNYISIKPAEIRMNMFDVGAYIDFNNLHLEGEYIHKTYENGIFPATDAFSTFMAYNIPINKKYLSKITPLIRFDTMTDNNRGRINTATNQYNIDNARKRITGGVTFSLDKPFLNDIRLNYEHYMYADKIINKDNKLVLEFVVRF